MCALLSGHLSGAPAVRWEHASVLNGSLLSSHTAARVHALPFQWPGATWVYGMGFMGLWYGFVDAFVASACLLVEFELRDVFVLKTKRRAHPSSHNPM